MFITLVSCGSMGDAKSVLKNEKIRSTDEFLVKKKDPLELPPNFNKIPKPDSINTSNKENTEDQKIRKMLNATNKQKGNNNKSSSIEESVLNKIRK